LTSVCIYFQVHQPYRLKWFWPDEHLPKNLEERYFDTGLNEWTLHKVAGKCYWPANQNILYNIDQLKGEKRPFKLSYSISGIFLEQCERWEPDLLETFKQMAETGCVEFICETYYHSLSSLFEDCGEFKEQVKQHKQTLKDLLGYTPQVCRNSELLYHNGIAEAIEELGFKATITEGIERVLEGWKSPNYIYRAKDSDLRVLLRNYKLSDDIGYRFGSKWWEEYPLDAGKYAYWLSAIQGDTINIFMDYETFGEHQWEDTGIFWFLNALPYKILDHEHLEFNTPSEVIEKYYAVGELNVPWYETVSWADLERDASAWLSNHMQHLNFAELKRLHDAVIKSRNPQLQRIWRMFQTSDHFYYQCTKSLADGDVHKYFSHHGTPYDAGINYHAIISDFKEQVLLGNASKETYTPDYKKHGEEMSSHEAEKNFEKPVESETVVKKWVQPETVIERPTEQKPVVKNPVEEPSSEENPIIELSKMIASKKSKAYHPGKKPVAREKKRHVFDESAIKPYQKVKTRRQKRK